MQTVFTIFWDEDLERSSEKSSELANRTDKCR